tara:strand:- start:47298 stop:47495 length:198 start_codon:yes stop_codon:yes gene_type:complete
MSEENKKTEGFGLIITKSEVGSKPSKYEFTQVNRNIPIEVIFAYLREFLKSEEEKFSKEFRAKFE